MNAVARVFVVLNLVLAAGFLLAAATFLSSRENWKDEAATIEKAKNAEIAAKVEEIALLQGERQDLQADASRKSAEITKLGNDKTNLETQLAAANREKNLVSRNLETLQGTHDTLANKVGALESELRNLRDQVDTYRNQSLADREARAAALEEKAAADEARDQAEGRINELEQTLAMTNGQLEETSSKLSDYIAAYPPPKARNQPKIDGFVLRFDPGTRLVEIDKGQAAGVSMGYEYDIVRGNNFICTIRIDRVTEDRAVGSVIIPMPGRQPRSGDRSTNL